MLATRSTRRVASFVLGSLALAVVGPATTAAPSASLGLTPIEICLTFGVSPDPCVLFTDDTGAGWGVFDIDIFQMIEEGLAPGDQIHVSGEYCTGCIHTFCGSFSGFIFDVTVSDCEPPPAFVADLNADGSVDGTDLNILLGNWGTSPEVGHGCDGLQPCAGDINADQMIDGLDLAILLSEWTG